MMSSRFSLSPRAKFIRNVLGLTAAAALTLMVFLLVAAFNGALKVMNEITNNMPPRCPDGYDLIVADDGMPSCVVKPPPPVMGIVPVTIQKLSEKPPAPPPPAPPARPKP